MEFEQFTVPKDDSKYASLLKHSPLLQTGSFLPWIIVSYLVLMCIFLASPYSQFFSGCTAPSEVPEWFVSITFGCGFAFFANALLQSYAIFQSKCTDSIDSVIVMYWSVLTIHFLSASSQLLYVFADRRICVDAFGVHSIATQWIEWIFTFPLLALLTSAVMEKTAVGIYSYIFVFNFALVIILAMLLIVDPAHRTVYGSFAMLQMFVSPAFASDIRHDEQVSKAMFENLDWLRTKQDIEQYIFLRQQCWSKKFVFSFLYLSGIFPIIYFLSALGFISNYMSCALFAVASLLEKLIFTSILSQSFMALQEDMLKLFTAASKAQETRHTLLCYVFHELRTPLYSVTTGLPSVCERLPYICPHISPADEQMLEMLQKSTDGLVDIVNQVLTLQSVQEGKVSMKMSIFRFSEWMDLMIQRAMHTLATNRIQLSLSDPIANQNFSATKMKLVDTASSSNKFRCKNTKITRNAGEDKASRPISSVPVLVIPDIIEGDVSQLSIMMQALCTSLTGIVSDGSKIDIVLSTTAPEDLFSRCVHDTNMLARSIVMSSSITESLMTIPSAWTNKSRSIASSSLPLSHIVATVMLKIVESLVIILYHLYCVLKGLLAFCDKVQTEHPFSFSILSGKEEYDNIYCSFRTKDFAGLSTESIQALYEPFQYLRHTEAREPSSSAHTSPGKEQPQKDLFQQQTGHDDTGLGFALAREIVHLMPGCFLVFLAGNQVKNLPAEICLCIRTRRISSSEHISMVPNLASSVDAALSCKFASSYRANGTKPATDTTVPVNDVSSVMMHTRLLRYLNPFIFSSPNIVRPGPLESNSNILTNTPVAAAIPMTNNTAGNTKHVFFATSHDDHADCMAVVENDAVQEISLPSVIGNNNAIDDPRKSPEESRYPL